MTEVSIQQNCRIFFIVNCFYFKTTKNRVPPWLRNILEMDKKLTKSIVDRADKFITLRSLRLQYKALEVTLDVMYERLLINIVNFRFHVMVYHGLLFG